MHKLTLLLILCLTSFQSFADSERIVLKIVSKNKNEKLFVQVKELTNNSSDKSNQNFKFEVCNKLNKQCKNLGDKETYTYDSIESKASRIEFIANSRYELPIVSSVVYLISYIGVSWVNLFSADGAMSDEFMLGTAGVITAAWAIAQVNNNIKKTEMLKVSTNIYQYGSYKTLALDICNHLTKNDEKVSTVTVVKNINSLIKNLAFVLNHDGWEEESLN